LRAAGGIESEKSLCSRVAVLKTHLRRAAVRRARRTRRQQSVRDRIGL